MAQYGWNNNNTNMATGCCGTKYGYMPHVSYYEDHTLYLTRSGYGLPTTGCGAKCVADWTQCDYPPELIGFVTEEQWKETMEEMVQFEKDWCCSTLITFFLVLCMIGAQALPLDKTIKSAITLGLFALLFVVLIYVTKYQAQAQRALIHHLNKEYYHGGFQWVRGQQQNYHYIVVSLVALREFYGQNKTAHVDNGGYQVNVRPPIYADQNHHANAGGSENAPLLASEPVPAVSTTHLPPGWRMAIDPNSGRGYFINDSKQITQWTVPVGTV